MPFSTARTTPPPSKRSPRAAPCLGLAALLLLLAPGGLQTAAADGETRTLSLHHTHTDETLTVTFKRNGRYDEAGLSKLNHFLRDWRNHEQTRMDPQLFDIVWEVYREVGASAPIQIISAYRSPATNAMLRARSRGVAQFSQHMLGKAMDFNIPGASLEQIRAAGLRVHGGGVGFYPSSGSPFVHVDVGSIRHWPRMSRDQLARVFPNGRTVHVPSDGQPLSGYAQALADVERRGSSPSRVSLAAARGAGIVTADASGGGGGTKPERSLLSKLFGFGGADKEDEGEEETTARTKRAPAFAGRGKKDDGAAQPATTQLASAQPIPMPRPRPETRGGADALVALVKQAPAASAPVRSALTPAQIVEDRGFWRGADVVAAAETSPLKSRAQQLVWQVGPQPVGVKTNETVARSTPASRPRPNVALAAAGADITASLPQWPGQKPEERAPRETVLAYAAQEPTAQTGTARAAPMGALAGTVVRKNAATGTASAASQSTSPFRLTENPWLRGVIAAPSMQTSMGVTVLGPPNYRALTRLMHKPQAAIANSFAADAPEFGLTVENFSGPAVGFVPTVMFGTRTAELR